MKLHITPQKEVHTEGSLSEARNKKTGSLRTPTSQTKNITDESDMRQLFLIPYLERIIGSRSSL
jgi:hypothetical protein